QAEEQSRLPYKWTQTIRDVDVLVPVPPHLRGRDIDASITKTHLRIGIKGQSPPIIDGPLTHPVLVDESTWTLEALGDGKGKEVSVHLDKSNKMEWWDAVVRNAEYKIDTSKIVPEDSKLGDLDGETRGMVEKMMYVRDFNSLYTTQLLPSLLSEKSALVAIVSGRERAIRKEEERGGTTKRNGQADERGAEQDGDAKGNNPLGLPPPPFVALFQFLEMAVCRRADAQGDFAEIPSPASGNGLFQRQNVVI
ncbi:MAG: hypothetical protein Q9214_000808, partial [Letrouitia sp. 1 TL-2023]